MTILVINLFHGGTYDFFIHQRISQRDVKLFLVINKFHRETYDF